MSLIGKGGAGFVFYPPIQCTGTVICTDCVSKLMLPTSHYTDEIKANKIISRLDISNSYHYPMLGYCIRANNDDLPVLYREYTAVIYYEKGEYDLRRALNRILNSPLDRPQAIDFIHKFVRLFDALIFFAENDFVHTDIKAENVIVDSKGEFRFIDFGLSFQGRPKDPGVYKENYPYWPPETIFLSDNSSPEAIAAKADYYETSPFTKVNSWLNTSIDLTTTLTNLKVSNLKKETIYYSMDIFGLGSLLSMAYIGLQYHLETPETKTKWHELLHHMVNYDINKRFSPKRARDEYLKILKHYPNYTPSSSRFNITR